MTGSLDESRVATLRDSFSGTLMLPGDRGYDDARRVFNAMIDKRPALIARCRSSSDVAAAIALAREGGLEVSVRGGGHGVAGRAVADDAVTIDLSSMKAVEVDAAARTARAQGGATWGEFNDATAEHGLATTGGVVSTTGIAGLTLGGGFGYLMPKHGMAADNLISAELVTADGDVLSVSADHHPDLFWALRGAGANFGVATTLEFRLHPLAQVVGGVVAHPFEATRDFLRFFAEYTADVSDDLYTFAGIAHSPDGSGVPVAVAAVGHCGDPGDADIELKPLFDFGSPVIAQVGPMPYPVINTMFDEAYPWGSLNYWKSSFLRELDDDAIDAMIDAFAGCPSPMTGVAMEHFHGAATRVGVSETAVPHREIGYSYLLTSAWTDPAASRENIAWTRANYAAMQPHVADRRYVNYLSEDDAPPGRAVYGVNYDRLTEIKATYDPDNVFHLNQNIEPRRA